MIRRMPRSRHVSVIDRQRSFLLSLLACGSSITNSSGGRAAVSRRPAGVFVLSGPIRQAAAFAWQGSSLTMNGVVFVISALWTGRHCRLLWRDQSSRRGLSSPIDCQGSAARESERRGITSPPDRVGRSLGLGKSAISGWRLTPFGPHARCGYLPRRPFPFLRIATSGTRPALPVVDLAAFAWRDSAHRDDGHLHHVDIGQLHAAACRCGWN